MAKSAPPTKKGEKSTHSRAAKRATSPGINTDKSLKNVQPPSQTTSFRPSILAIHAGAGVSKRSKNGRKSVLSAKARRRQEKGLDRAEAVMDKTERKIEKSKGKARTIQGRSRAWDEQNKKMTAHQAMLKAFDNPQDEDEDQENWTDDDDGQANQQATESVEKQDYTKSEIVSLGPEMQIEVEKDEIL